MISKEKLRKFLFARNQEANKEILFSNYGDYYKGQAQATFEIIIKLDAGEFDEEVQK